LDGGEADKEQARSNISVEKRETIAMEGATGRSFRAPSFYNIRMRARG